jgi:hypothetical protein
MGAAHPASRFSVELPAEVEPALAAAHTLGVTAAEELLDELQSRHEFVVGVVTGNNNWGLDEIGRICGHRVLPTQR